MLAETYYIIPFGVVIFLLLRLVVSSYIALLLSSLLFGAVVVLKAKKSDEYIWKELHKDIKLVGHRGCALNAPENTLASVREAHRLGMKAIEIDVLLTSDNEPVVFHDSTVDRTTDGHGEVASLSWREIQKLDASSKYTGPGFRGEKVPHLREILKEAKKYGLMVFLDMKGSRPISMAKVLTQMTREFPDLHEWAVVCSFYPQLLYSVKWQLPQFSTILTHRPWVLTLADTDGPYRNEELWKRVAAPVADVLLELSIYHFWWYFCGANAVFVQQEVVSIREVKYWKARGLDIFIWTVNNPDRKAYLRSINVPYITDDCTE